MPEPAAQPPATLADVLAVLLRIEQRLDAGPAEGLDASGAAALCGVERSTWHRLVSGGMAPEAVQIGVGRCPRWLRSEVLAWLRAGAPSRARWVMMRNQAMRKIA